MIFHPYDFPPFSSSQKIFIVVKYKDAGGKISMLIMLFNAQQLDSDICSQIYFFLWQFLLWNIRKRIGWGRTTLGNFSWNNSHTHSHFYFYDFFRQSSGSYSNRHFHSSHTNNISFSLNHISGGLSLLKINFKLFVFSRKRSVFVWH